MIGKVEMRKIVDNIKVLVLRIAEAFFASALWVVWVNFEPQFKEIARDLFEIDSFAAFFSYIGIGGAGLLLYLWCFFAFIRYTIKDINQRIKMLRSIKKKVVLPLKSTMRIFR